MCDIFHIAVPPYVSTPVLGFIHDLKTSFNLPCGVTIGEVSRDAGFEVTWVRYTHPWPSGLSTIISYDSQEDDYQEIVPANDGLHNLVIANLSLNIDECTVDLEFTENVVYHYECQVSTVNPNTGSKLRGVVKTMIAFKFGKKKLLHPKSLACY